VFWVFEIFDQKIDAKQKKHNGICNKQHFNNGHLLILLNKKFIVAKKL
jgi:hypothetical protein